MNPRGSECPDQTPGCPARILWQDLMWFCLCDEVGHQDNRDVLTYVEEPIMRFPNLPVRLLAATALLASTVCHGAANSPASRETVLAEATVADQLPHYQNRFGRNRPVVAVIAENGATEMTDFVIPYSVLKEAQVAEVVALAIKPGNVTMLPTSLQLVPQSIAAQFDITYPEGADYVIVPAAVKYDDSDLIAWVASQAAKGATVVSICDGAFVVANAGLFKGRHATAHWFTDAMRRQAYPNVTWVKNTRYVADGKVISTAGISASMPVSFALVDAIGGHDVAKSVAASYGFQEWTSRHNSEMFEPRIGNLGAFLSKNFFNKWFHSTDKIGVSVSAGVDDVTFALTMDAYSRTGRSKAFAVSTSAAPFSTRSGLTFVPDATSNSGGGIRTLPELPKAPAPHAFDRVLDSIADTYGKSTADAVANDFEYARGSN
jgi:putative intracellular protease/amidase